MFIAIERDDYIEGRIQYNIAVSVKPGKLAIPLRERERERELNIEPGHIGEIAFEDVMGDEDCYECLEFYPFGIDGDERFIGKGYADSIERLIIRDLLEVLGPNMEISHFSANRHRRRQLERLGIKPCEFYTLEDYAKIIGVELED